MIFINNRRRDKFGVIRTITDYSVEIESTVENVAIIMLGGNQTLSYKLFSLCSDTVRWNIFDLKLITHSFLFPLAHNAMAPV